jgi:hypothetical protein
MHQAALPTVGIRQAAKRRVERVFRQRVTASPATLL